MIAISALLASGAACDSHGGGPQAEIAPGQEAPGNAVVDWNAIALRTTAAAPLDPPREARNLAIVHGAVYDAVISITGGFRPYLAEARASSGASTDAAVAAAAHDTLVALYPEQQVALDEAYESAMAEVVDGTGQDAGAAAGREAAARLLEHRAEDHADDRASYPGGTGAGEWRPTPPRMQGALGSGWGRVTPFVLHDSSQFRSSGPYSVTSPEYARDFDEVKSTGAARSTTRTEDQTVAARFWAAPAPHYWNQPAQYLAVSEELGVAETARLFAHLSFAEADAAIVAWDMKFTFGQWRPVTGIRSAADDGNTATAPDLEWEPLLPTPPYPDYVCGHSSLAGAAETVLERYFGTKRDESLWLTSPAIQGVTRQYATFRVIADEVTDARVWAGVHWRSSCEAGRQAGRHVGRYVVSHTLAKTKG